MQCHQSYDERSSPVSFPALQALRAGLCAGFFFYLLISSRTPFLELEKSKVTRAIAVSYEKVDRTCRIRSSFLRGTTREEFNESFTKY